MPLSRLLSLDVRLPFPLRRREGGASRTCSSAVPGGGESSRGPRTAPVVPRREGGGKGVRALEEDGEAQPHSPYTAPVAPAAQSRGRRACRGKGAGLLLLPPTLRGCQAGETDGDAWCPVYPWHLCFHISQPYRGMSVLSHRERVTSHRDIEETSRGCPASPPSHTRPCFVCARAPS